MGGQPPRRDRLPQSLIVRSYWPTIALLSGSLLSLLPAAVPAQSSQAALDRRLQRVERLLDSSTLKGLLQRVDAQQREIRSLQGANDVLNHKLKLLEQRLSGLSTPTPAEAPPAADSSNTEASAPTATTADTADPAPEQAAYSAAFQLLRDGEYSAAVTALQQQLQDYPNGRYAANAQYWIGEAHYVEQQFEPAMQAFQQVINDYPGSAKSPDAMLKIGMILTERGNKDDARQMFQVLIQRFPDSSAASLASMRIKP